MNLEDAPPADREPTSVAGRQSLSGSLALVGMSGCGKTTVGEMLAESMGLAFHDSDREIERDAGMAITQLFAQRGEADFRIREREAVARILGGQSCVIATGGGALADPDTFGLLDRETTTIWLDASVETLLRNVGSDDSRPLLRVPPEALRARLTEMLDRRRPSYARADIRIACDGKSPDAIVADIVARLDQQGWLP